MSTSTKKFISDIQGESTNPEEHSYGSHLTEGLVQGLTEFHSSWDMQVWCTVKDAPWRPCLLHFYPAVFRVHTSKTLDKKNLEITN